MGVGGCHAGKLGSVLILAMRVTEKGDLETEGVRREDPQYLDAIQKWPDKKVGLLWAPQGKMEMARNRQKGEVNTSQKAWRWETRGIKSRCRWASGDKVTTLTEMAR